MKQVIHEQNSRPIKIWTDDIEDSALSQLKNLARLPFIHKHGVVAMPDVHSKKSSGMILWVNEKFIRNATEAKKFAETLADC